MLRIEQAQFDAIRQHGEATYPHECCGVLLGHAAEGVNTVIDDDARRQILATDSAHNRYQIAPQELIRIQRDRHGGKGWTSSAFIIRIPDHPAQWSKTDLAEAHWLGCSYVITSVVGNDETREGRDVGPLETNSFLLTGTGEEDKRLQPQPIEVTDAVADSVAAIVGA